MDKPPHEFEPHWLTTLKYWWPVAVVAIVTRLMRYREAVAKREEKFWKIDLVWELGMAGLCTVVSIGTANYLNLDISGACALTTVVSWIGLKGIQAGILKTGNSKGL